MWGMSTNCHALKQDQEFKHLAASQCGDGVGVFAKQVCDIRRRTVAAPYPYHARGGARDLAAFLKIGIPGVDGIATGQRKLPDGFILCTIQPY